MRDHISLLINGCPHRVHGADALLTLSDYLRRRLTLTGTKIVCSEGDCGSCTVLCGQISNGVDAVSYYPIDSCIRFMFQLDGMHVVTVEGLTGGHSVGERLAGAAPELSEVQQKMVDCHGSQCGFCTPGFVVAMTGLVEQKESANKDGTQEVGPLDEQDLRDGLTGNLCRCTGYSPIIDAGIRCDGKTDRLNDLYPVVELRRVVNARRKESIHMNIGEQSVFCPATLDDTTKLLAEYPDARLAAGATDLGVQINKGRSQPQFWIDLNRVDELAGIAVTDVMITAGARATWTELAVVMESAVPELHRIISVFGSPQIRHVGTIGGNLINASPIADSIPFLYVCDAVLELVSSDGSRMIPINDFYQDYKQFDLRPGELLAAVQIPRPPADRRMRLYKISRRRDLDISSFTAAIWLELQGDIIKDAGLAYGAVGPVVLRLRNTEEFLRGKTFCEETMLGAGDIAVSEISPLSDVRGSADYRLQLARNVLLKFYHQEYLEPVQA